MSRHIGKLLFFVLLQAGVYYACYSASETRKKILPMPPLADEDRLTPLVRAKTLPLWRRVPDIIDRATAKPPRNKLAHALACEYIAGPNHYLQAARDKYKRLQSAAGERLILVGGSNLAFGMDSELLEERYGIRAVNLGLLADLGVRFMTRQVSENVRDGDVVILAIEYRAMCSDPDCTPQRRETFCRHCAELAPLFEPDKNAPPDRRLMARWREIKRFADRLALADFSSHVETIANALLPSDPPIPSKLAEPEDKTAEQDHAIAQASDKTPTLSEAEAREQELLREFDNQIPSLVAAVQEELNRLDTLYVRSRFNSLGDLTGHWHHRAPQADKIDRILDESKHALDSIEEDYLRQNIALLNECADRWRAAGATVYFSHAPLLRADHTKGFASKYEAILKEALEITTLSPVESCFVELDELFDTCYHLNGRGISRRMLVWTTALDKELTPQLSLSPAEHVAAHWRTQPRNNVIAANPQSPAVQTH